MARYASGTFVLIDSIIDMAMYVFLFMLLLTFAVAVGAAWAIMWGSC